MHVVVKKFLLQFCCKGVKGERCNKGFEVLGVIPLMEEIRLTGRLVVCPSIYKVSHISGG